jgi:alkylation response protein AidB-like acyl-CoA dehydrogenase
MSAYAEIAGHPADILTARSTPTVDATADLRAAMLSRVGDVVKASLAPIVRAIDEDDLYPGDVLRSLGAAGAYSAHVPSVSGVTSASSGSPDILAAIEAIAIAGRECLSTAFCMWCQSTLAWYVENTDNAALKARFAPAVASGALLGGTGLSNPMKALFDIERFKLKATAEGYVVRGALPWVSNLGPDHAFGTIFEVEEDGRPIKRVMALIPCDHPGVTLVPSGAHLALDGTGTYAVQFRDCVIGPDLILAAPAEPFVRKVRQGFILLQMGMAVGVIRGCIDIQRRMEGTLGHVNRFLDDQPEQLEAELHALLAEVRTLAAAPYDESGGRWRRLLEARLAGSHLSLRAAQAAMLFSGARGYVKAGAAQRRLREAYFVAIVTPATKQLRKMIADVEQQAASH